MVAKAAARQPLTPVAEAFTACQKTVACHKKYILALDRQRKEDPDEFAQQFKQCLNSMLIVFKREPAVERLVALTSKFVALDENGEVDSTFAVELIEHLLPYARAKDKAVRLRVCQLVGAILGSMGENLDVDDDLWDAMMEEMLTRSRDKVPSVRAAACLAVSFFQDPEEEDDPVVLELIRLMGTDADKAVRKTALQNIAITRSTLPHVMRRLRDNKADVRKLLYQVIAWKLPVKKLNIALRCEILTAGLGERTPTVREACLDLLCNTWLRDNLSSDPFKLLTCLDAEVNEEIATSALKAVFDRHAKSRKRITGAGPTEWDAIANEKLSAATSGDSQCNLAAVEAMYLRVRTEWCKQQRGGVWQDVLDRLLLDLSSMTELCTYHYQQCKTPIDASEDEQTAAESDIFITRQLLTCIAKADFGDEAGRRTVVDMLRGMFQDTETPSALLEDAMVCMQSAAMNEEEYIHAVVEVISELKEPLQAETDDEDAMLIEQTWFQCLDMASCLLKTTQRSLSNGQVKGLETTLLLPAVQHREACVRDRGVLALGQYCLLDKEVATRYLMLFLQAVRNDVEPIQHTSMKVLYDMLFAFNLAAVETDATDDAEPSTLQAVIMETLVPFLSSSSEELRTTAVEGACKLMISSRINDPQLLSRLLILFFNPTTVEDVRLRQCLSVFFQAFAFSSPHHRISIEACFLPTLRVCVHAPKTSPLREINLAELAEYMLNLTNNAALPEASATRGGTAAELAAGVHERLGVVLLNEVMSEPDSTEARAFCKALNSLNLVPPQPQAAGEGSVGLPAPVTDSESVQTLSVLATNAAAVVTNRFAKTALTKFQNGLDALLEDGAGSMSDEARQEVLKRTQSHFARRKDEINAALLNAGESGRSRQRRRFYSQEFEQDEDDKEEEEEDEEDEEVEEEEDDDDEEEEETS